DWSSDGALPISLIEGTIDQFRTGWTYTHAGTPVAYVMSLDDPGNATIIPFDRWWSALRFAMVFAGQNGCEYVGGPKQ
ncbi:MAG: hypothetical protein KKD08_01100, partial [Alphaproteobacteria bacterium]|nr:hypothetical protein [Alphaproteobacteria bacterium]